MAKDYRKKKKSCVPLDGYQAEQLARLIIAETERKVHYGTERKKRIAAVQPDHAAKLRVPA